LDSSGYAFVRNLETQSQNFLVEIRSFPAWCQRAAPVVLLSYPLSYSFLSVYTDRAHSSQSTIGSICKNFSWNYTASWSRSRIKSYCSIYILCQSGSKWLLRQLLCSLLPHWESLCWSCQQSASQYLSTTSDSMVTHLLRNAPNVI
jgi:hypothetical protein